MSYTKVSNIYAIGRKFHKSVDAYSLFANNSVLPNAPDIVDPIVADALAAALGFVSIGTAGTQEELLPDESLLARRALRRYGGMTTSFSFILAKS